MARRLSMSNILTARFPINFQMTELGEP